MTSIIPTIVEQYKQTGPIMSAGDGAKTSTYYSDDALYINAAGAPFNGVAAISTFIAKASTANVEGMTFGDIQTHKAKAGVYVVSSFTFSMKLPSMTQRITVSGKRFSVWQKQQAGPWKMRVDAWLPNKPEDDATKTTFSTAQGKVSSAWQGKDYTTLGTLYSAQSTIVMSDGSVRHGVAQTQAFLTLSKQFNVDEYTTAIKQSTPLSETAFYGQSTYSFTMTPAPKQTMKMSGCRLVLWHKEEARWKMLLDFAIPSHAQGCTM